MPGRNAWTVSTSTRSHSEASGTSCGSPNAVAAMVGLYITAGYWFTASTSFANPAVTVARSFTDTFSGILPAHAPAFIVAQFVGATVALLLFRWLERSNGTTTDED